MGVLDKLVLVWDAPWWPPRQDFVLRAMPTRAGRWCGSGATARPGRRSGHPERPAPRPDHPQSLLFLPTAPDPHPHPQSPTHPVPHTPTPPYAPPRSVYLNYAPLFNRSILVALNSADDARAAEAMSDEDAVADALQARGRACVRLHARMHVRGARPRTLQRGLACNCAPRKC